MAKFIMLRLEGLLQAWGESAVWDNRSTAVMPTKSGARVRNGAGTEKRAAL